MPTLLILGACSGIAQSCAWRFAHEGWDLHLAARNISSLASMAKDLSCKTGREVTFSFFDASNQDEHSLFWQKIECRIDAVLCAVGYLGDQKKAETDPELMQRIINCNYSGLLYLLTLAAFSFAKKGRGLIIGVSSVAGERGRASNYFYGSSKAAFTAFLSGLRGRFYGSGVRVLTVKPGYVRTAMTSHKKLPPLLTATPDEVARDIIKAVKKKKQVVYSRWFWRWIICFYKQIPEFIAMRLKY